MSNVTLNPENVTVNITSTTATPHWIWDTFRNPKPSWGDMTRDQRVAALAPLVGKPVRFVESKTYLEDKRVMGPNWPIPWVKGVLKSLTPVTIGGEKLPGAHIELPSVPIYFLPYTFPVVKGYALADIHLIESDPDAEPEESED